MNRFLYLIVLLFLLSFAYSSCSRSGKIHVMVVAGGHSFDTTEFVDMFRTFEGMTFDTVMQPHANEIIASGEAAKYDAIIFYDMWPEAEQQVREGYLKLARDGRGMVFLHHSLVSYQAWPEFRNIIGGKYFAEWSGEDSSLLSTYRHDIDIPVEVMDGDHPVNIGISNFTIHDEGYGNIQVNDDVKILLRADHPDCYPVIGWEHNFENSKIVYLMLGHDRKAYANDHFRLLLQNAIRYVQ